MKRLGHGLTLPINDALREPRQTPQPTSRPAAQAGEKAKVASQAGPVAATATATVASESLNQSAPADDRRAHPAAEKHAGATDTTTAAPSGAKRSAPPPDGDTDAEGARESKRSARN